MYKTFYNSHIENPNQMDSFLEKMLLEDNLELVAANDNYYIFKEAAQDTAEAGGTDKQQLKPKIPDYLELLSTIDDSRLTIMDGKENVRVGTRLMYDSFVRYFGR